MALNRQLTLMLRHLLRRNVLTRRRAAALIAREREPGIRQRERQAVLLRASIAAARRQLPRYALLPEPSRDADPFDWVRLHCPLVSKAELLIDRAGLYPNSGHRRPWWSLGKTSGTSGTPLEVFRSIDSVIWEEAFQLQFWAWAGFEQGAVQAVLRGDAAAPADRREPPFWLWDRFGRQLFLSTRHLSSQTAVPMLDAIAASGAQLLRAYPSSGFELARLAEAANHPLRLRAVVTGSEPLYPLQREQLERAFGCRVFDFYGMAERIAYAGQCEHGFHHLNPEYAWVEILDDAGQPTVEFGAVVGTTLRNHLMPLLRYRIADRARWIVGDCPCGRTYPRIELSSGKVEDQLFDSYGTAISASIITFAFKGLGNIRRSQVAQIGPGRWEIRVVPDAGYSLADGEALLANISAYVSDKLTVTVRVVDDIPLMSSGKFKWVSQEWQGAR